MWSRKWYNKRQMSQAEYLRVLDTLPETNTAAASRPSQKETSLPVRAVGLRDGDSFQMRQCQGI